MAVGLTLSSVGCYGFGMATGRRVQTVPAVYENGTIQFRSTVKLNRKLPLRNHTILHFRLELPPQRRSVALQTFGILRVPKRLARLVAESPQFSVLNS